MANLGNIRLRGAQALARRYAQLLSNQIKAGYHLGHRMFDLKAGVHFQEIKGPILCIDEFDSPCPAVFDGAGNSGSGLADLIPLLGGQRR